MLFTRVNVARCLSLRRGYATASRPNTALFFPGAGSQKIGMLKPWREAFPHIVNPFFEEVDETLKFSLSRMIEEGRNETLTETVNAQPAIFATSIMILRILEQDFGFKTAERMQFTLGHSLGEYAALCAGGYLSFKDSLIIVRKRAEVFASAAKEAKQKYGDPVGMVALLCEVNHFGRLLDDIRNFLGSGTAEHEQVTPDKGPQVQHVAIANINSSNQVVLAGSLPEIKKLLARLQLFGGHDPRSVVLKEACPFHHPYMQPAADFTMKYFAKGGVVTFPGAISCISNVTARPFQSEDEMKDLVARGAAEPVLWWDSIKYLDQERKVRRWLGIGPGKVGRNLVGKSIGYDYKGTAAKTGGVWSITEPKEVEEVLRALDDTEAVDIEE